MSFDALNALQSEKPDGKKSLFSSENSPENPHSDDKDSGDDSTIVVDHTLVLEMPDPPPSKIGPPIAFKETQDYLDSKKWESAMQKGLETLEEDNTSIITKSPVNACDVRRYGQQMVCKFLIICYF